MTEVYRNLVDLRERAKEEVSKVVLGQDRAVDLLLVAALARGHVLLEGPPGSAKTLMGRAIAHMLGASFNRIQFNPDTTPTELVGEYVEKSLGERVYEPGVVYTNVLLADEINRTPAAHPVRAPRGDAGAPGDGRGPEPQAQGSLPRHRHAERERVRGRVPAARVAARPVPLQGRARVREREGRARDARPPARRPDARHDRRHPSDARRRGAREGALRAQRDRASRRGRALHRRRGQAHA